MQYERFVTYKRPGGGYQGQTRLLRFWSDKPISDTRLQHGVEDHLGLATNVSHDVHIEYLGHPTGVLVVPRILAKVMQGSDGILYMVRIKAGTCYPKVQLVSPYGTLQQALISVQKDGYNWDQGPVWTGDPEDFIVVAYYDGEQMDLDIAVMMDQALDWAGLCT